MAKRMFLNQLNTKDPKLCVEFYKKLGFVEDPGFNFTPEAPVNPLPGFTTSMGVDEIPESNEFVMLKLPDDDYHLEVGAWKKLAEPSYPPKFNQAGVVRISFLVDDIDQEIAGVRAQGIPILYGPETLHLDWGTTRFAFIKDPDGNFVEFLEIRRVK